MKRILVLFLFACAFYSCSDNSSEEEQILGPKDLEVDLEFKGNYSGIDDGTGDGSGVVYIWVKAKNTNQFKVTHEGSELIKSYSGYYRFIGKKPGINQYEVVVEAINTETNLSISKTVSFEVEKIYTIPESLFANLMVGNKKWRIDKEASRHVQTGPGTSDEITWHTHENESKYASMYDDTYEFGYQNMIHETNGEVVGKVEPLHQDFGPIEQNANDDGEYVNYPLGGYTTSWLYGGDWTLHMDGKGFIGSYVGGDHVYKIMSHSKTRFAIKTLDAEGNYWYFVLTSE